MKRLATILAASLLALVTANPGQAQTAANYPNNAVKFTVPFPAGGSTDILSRIIGQHLSDTWKQPVVVENRTGASGAIGTSAVIGAPADGYNLLMGITVLIQMPHLKNDLPYDSLRDLAPISQIALSTDLLVVANSVPANTLEEFIALVKANPKKYTYGSYGNATSSHIRGETLNREAGIDMVHVPYRGSAPMLADLLGGHLPAAFVDVGSAYSHLSGNKFKVLAVSGTKRLSFLPNAPTMAERGIKGFEPYGWFAMFVKAGTPKDIVDKISKEVGRIVARPDVQARFTELGLTPVGGTAEELAVAMKRDSEIWGQLIKSGGIKLE